MLDLDPVAASSVVVAPSDWRIASGIDDASCPIGGGPEAASEVKATVTDRLVSIMRWFESEGDPDASLELLCRTSVRALGVSGAAVVLILTGDDPSSLAASDQLASRFVDLQFTIGEGPSIDAFTSGRPVLVGDLAAVSRWPAFAPEAIAAGAAALFALPLQVGAARFGALTLYRDQSGPLGPAVLSDALAIADLACEITICLQARVPPGSLAQVVDGVAAQRTVVYQATGMVLAQLGISPEAALAILRARAYAVGRSVGEVSADVVARKLRFDP